MIHLTADLMARIRTLDERMETMLSGDDRFTFALWLCCLYNPDIAAANLAEIVAESLEGGNFPSLRTSPRLIVWRLSVPLHRAVSGISKLRLRKTLLRFDSRCLHHI